MATITGVEVEAQDSSIPNGRKNGIEVVHSANVSRSRYFGPRPGRPTAARELSTHDRLTLLCGQLRLLRRRAELGLIVTADSIERAERLASSLEAAA